MNPWEAFLDVDANQNQINNPFVYQGGFGKNNSTNDYSKLAYILSQNPALGYANDFNANMMNRGNAAWNMSNSVMQQYQPYMNKISATGDNLLSLGMQMFNPNSQYMRGMSSGIKKNVLDSTAMNNMNASRGMARMGMSGAAVGMMNANNRNVAEQANNQFNNFYQGMANTGAGMMGQAGNQYAAAGGLLGQAIGQKQGYMNMANNMWQSGQNAMQWQGDQWKDMYDTLAQMFVDRNA